jgi:hypothetical protein
MISLKPAPGDIHVYLIVYPIIVFFLLVLGLSIWCWIFDGSGDWSFCVIIPCGGDLSDSLIPHRSGSSLHARNNCSTYLAQRNDP